MFSRRQIPLWLLTKMMPQRCKVCLIVPYQGQVLGGEFSLPLWLIQRLIRQQLRSWGSIQQLQLLFGQPLWFSQWKIFILQVFGFQSDWAYLQPVSARISALALHWSSSLPDGARSKLGGATTEVSCTSWREHVPWSVASAVFRLTSSYQRQFLLDTPLLLNVS